MATNISLKGLRYYQRRTTGTIIRLRKYPPHHMTSLSSLVKKIDEEREIPNMFVSYFENTPKDKWGFFYHGELPEDVVGKRFKLIETVNTQQENRIIPNAQCLYLDDRRRFFFSRRTGKSWEVV